MTTSQGMTKNLSEGRIHGASLTIPNRQFPPFIQLPLALQAILNSVSAGDESEVITQDGQIPENQIQRISDKLGELFGGDPNLVDGGPGRNKKGEVRFALRTATDLTSCHLISF